jgi:hypothetical protein
MALALVSCASETIAIDGGSSETSGDGDGPSNPLESLECAGVLRLEPTTARAWLMDGGAEIELPLVDDSEALLMVGAAAGDYVAVARVDRMGDDWTSIVHVFSRSSGELLWTREIPDKIHQMWITEDGWITGQIKGVWGILMSDTVAIELEHHKPVGPRVLDHVATEHYVGSGPGEHNRSGWVDLDDLSWQQPVTGETYAGVDVDGFTFEFGKVMVDGTSVYVRARPGEAETIVLPFEPPLEYWGLGRLERAGRYRLIRQVDRWDYTQLHLARVDIDAGEAVLVDPELPPGWSFFDCWDRHIWLDSEGRVFYELRRDASARVWAYDIDEDTWTPVGLEFGNIADIEVTPLSRDVLSLRGRPNNDTCSADWSGEPPEDALTGWSLQLVRREPALALVVPPDRRLTLVDGQQRCAASLLEEDGWEVRPLDGSDTVIDLGPGTGDWIWLD